MSELINNRDNRAAIRWKLLTSASALALTAAVSTMAVARAEDADRPLIWIELGGQMEHFGGQGAVFSPPFLAANPNSPVFGSLTPLQAQQPSTFSFGEEGSISFQPKDSDWVFSASARVGRSNNFRHVHHQTDNTFYKYQYTNQADSDLDTKADFADTQSHRSERHAILDFMAGKDVGLGLFGPNGSSVVSAGVRIAQFSSRSSVDMRALPDRQIKYASYPSFGAKFAIPYFNTYHATGEASRSFRGMGPSISWTGSAPFAGNAQDGELTFDWGVNAALLFGRQKARVQHHESAHYYGNLAGVFNPTHVYVSVYNHATRGHVTNRAVTVPNVGGFAGLSFLYSDAKISFGYRADFFFGAMDTGIDAVKKSNATFNGPYASISIGLGD